MWRSFESIYCAHVLQCDHAKLLDKKLERDRAVQQLQQRIAALENSASSSNGNSSSSSTNEPGGPDANTDGSYTLELVNTRNGNVGATAEVAGAVLAGSGQTAKGVSQPGGPRGLGTNMRGGGNARGRGGKGGSGIGQAALLEALQQEKSARLAAEAQVGPLSTSSMSAPIKISTVMIGFTSDCSYWLYHCWGELWQRTHASGFPNEDSQTMCHGSHVSVCLHGKKMEALEVNAKPSCGGQLSHSQVGVCCRGL